MALYTDRASHFKTTRHGGLHYDIGIEYKDTQKAKGRIERLFRFFRTDL